MRVTVNTSVLQWAVARSGDRAALIERFPRLEQWLAGKAHPTLKQLERLAKATLLPFGYFFLDHPPVEALPIRHYRTVDDDKALRPSAELLETVYAMQARQAWMREYLVERGEDKLGYVGSSKYDEPPKKIANRIKLAMGLAEDWAKAQPTWSKAFRFLINRVEEIGILVVVNSVVHNNTRRRLNVEEFRGFVLVDEYAPLVFINGADAKAAQMFTLAHELAHVWFGSSAAFDLRELQPAPSDFEQACNRVAAEFLVPEQAFRDHWRSVARSSTRYEQTARVFKVSQLVAARRASDLQLIDANEYRDFYRAYMQRAARKEAHRRRGDFYATQTMRIGQRFAKAVAQALADGQLLYREAYHLTGLSGRTFDRFFERLLGGKTA
jgi:Zn-dependent peptidase ImmA (M78 family)